MKILFGEVLQRRGKAEKQRVRWWVYQTKALRFDDRCRKVRLFGGYNQGFVGENGQPLTALDTNWAGVTHGAQTVTMLYMKLSEDLTPRWAAEVSVSLWVGEFIYELGPLLFLDSTKLPLHLPCKDRLLALDLRWVGRPRIEFEPTTILARLQLEKEI